MPEVIDDAQQELESSWKPALAYGAGTAVGSMAFGPLGRGAGALLAGSYVGGTQGSAMASIGMGESLEMLLTGVAGGGGGSGGATQV